ncbi:hypothetical protein JYT93_00660 [bacterium AH-315-J19]|nr:hypothetical protein [Robiginitomaculum sp.]MBN4058526.1 hypothetical protein [bacterium AH-315-J19]
MPDIYKNDAPVFPAPYKGMFTGGIVHPELWLWDSWCFEQDGVTHLYCLALSRHTENGKPIHPRERNQYPFHIRHFISKNQGYSWEDCGMFQSLSPNAQSYYSRNIWSGSVKPVPGGHKLVGFTGIRLQDKNHEFLQSIGVGRSRDGFHIDSIQPQALSCPMRDYDDIIAAGYYLGPRDDLGANAGEGGGPILAWRDPFIFVDASGEIHMFWSAKILPQQGAIAHAVLEVRNEEYRIKKLHKPMTLPDGADITQAEVPKILHDKKRGLYYLLISACNRLHEDQKESEVSKTSRLYKSESLRGPWQFYRPGSSIIPGLENCFGASVLRADFDNDELHLICPITEKAAPKWQLTFAPLKTMSLK